MKLWDFWVILMIVKVVIVLIHFTVHGVSTQFCLWNSVCCLVRIRLDGYSHQDIYLWACRVLKSLNVFVNWIVKNMWGTVKTMSFTQPETLQVEACSHYCQGGVVNFLLPLCNMFPSLFHSIKNRHMCPGISYTKRDRSSGRWVRPVVPCGLLLNHLRHG